MVPSFIALCWKVKVAKIIHEGVFGVVVRFLALLQSFDHQAVVH
jgi:hypothetical protein